MKSYKVFLRYDSLIHLKPNSKIMYDKATNEYYIYADSHNGIVEIINKLKFDSKFIIGDND